MTSWRQFAQEAPELAALARARFDAHGLALLATLRADGSPRISGLEPVFAGGELWLGMMPRSVKGADLRRDGRFALHSATIDKTVRHGDAKINGVAHPVSDPAEIGRFVDAVAEQTGYHADGADVFRCEVMAVAVVRVEHDELVISSWRPGAPTEVVRRQ